MNKVYSLAVPEGTIMNGIITGEQRLQETLEQIWNRYSLPRKGLEKKDEVLFWRRYRWYDSKDGVIC